MPTEEHPDDAARRGIPVNDPVAPSSPEIPVPPSRNPPDPPQRAIGSQPARPSSVTVNMTRLREAMDWSSRQIRPFRERHEEGVKFYAGQRYGDNNVGRTPVNVYQLAINIWKRQLVSKNPRVLAITQSPELKADAYELELVVNHLLAAMKFGATLQEAVQQAMFSMGIIRVGVTNPYLSRGTRFRNQAGDVYADCVLFEDWLHDMNAKRKGDWEWCGNRYRVPYEDVMENPDFDARVKSQIKAHNMGFSEGLEAGAGGTGRTTNLSTGTNITRTEYRDHVELWDIWIPSDNVVVTLPAQYDTEPLQVKEWEGPESGPYHLLSFSKVPGNLLPVAPAQSIYDLQYLMTNLFNQLARQASRQKTLTIVESAGQADKVGERIRDASDGQMIDASHVDSVKEFRTGGIDSSNFLFTKWVKDLFSYMGGNLDAMGGLERQANTLGQERLLAESSSEMLRDMQTSVVDFTQNVTTDIAWYAYTDPTMRVTLTKPIEGYGAVPFEYGPEQRTEEFFHYNFEVQPYSLVSQSPQERLQKVLSVATTLALPLAPQMAEFGLTFNIKKLFELIAKYSDSPEISDLISSEVPLEGETTVLSGGSDRGRTRQSPNTTRNYVRENRSPDKPSAEDEIIKAVASLPQGGQQSGA